MHTHTLFVLTFNDLIIWSNHLEDATTIFLQFELQGQKIHATEEIMWRYQVMNNSHKLLLRSERTLLTSVGRVCGPGDFHIFCFCLNKLKWNICKESTGYTSRDIEIFITAYEITASIVKQTRAYRAHPLLLGQSVFGTKMDRGLMRNIN